MSAAFEDPALATYWVAESEEGTVVASTSIVKEWSNFHGGSYWWIQSLFIDPAHRGAGLVEVILDHLADEAAHAGALDLRLYAIRRLGERNDEQTIDQLISLYDAEKDEQVKATLIRSFGESPQKNAVRKLISIARDSQSVELRKLAVRKLGESKDPEALKFLEELLK